MEDIGMNEKLSDDSQKTVTINHDENLEEPKPLDDESFRKLMIDDLEANHETYLMEVADRHHLNLSDEREKVLDEAYEEQVAVITRDCILDALDENTAASYSLLQKVCFFNQKDIAYMVMSEGGDFSESIPKYVDARLENVQVLKPVVDFTCLVNQAILYSTSDNPNLSSYNVNQIAEKFENMDIFLTDEGRAKLYFISSKLYRQLDAKNNTYNIMADAFAGNQETECLRKVLALSTDYKLISYCQNRLNSKGSEKDVVRAYKRALTKKQSRFDSYRINKELAAIYLNRSRKAGYLVRDSDKAVSAEKAINHLMNAYRYAKKEDKLPILKQLADTHRFMGRTTEWKNIKELIAMKFLKGRERCMALISIADKTDDVSFYRRAIEEMSRGKMKGFDKLCVEEAALSGMLRCMKDDQSLQNVKERLRLVSSQKRKYTSIDLLSVYKKNTEPKSYL